MRSTVKHHPFVSVGVIEENHPHLEQAKYQGAHHQFIASALATKACHEIIKGSQVGCMISYQLLVPYSCDPMIFKTIEQQRTSFCLVMFKQEDIIQRIRNECLKKRCQLKNRSR